MDLVNHLSDRLLFAVPKKGRLQQPTLDLLAGSDIQFRRETRLDIALVKNHPLALIFLPAADIPTFVGEGRVDLGITGWDQVEEHAAVMRKRRIEEARNENEAEVGNENENVEYSEGASSLDTEVGDGNIEETNNGVEEILDLGFGRCKLQVQVPENGDIQKPEQLVGKNVVTSFVGLTEQYFRSLEREEDAKRGVSADGEMIWKGEEAKLRTRIMYVGGSVEAACALGVADGIVDLVESGETMKAAGLKAIDTVVESKAVLIQSKHPSNRKLVDLISSRISGVITAQKFVLCQYNIPRSLLPKASQITPGKRAPTVTALDEAAWVAVSSMVEKSKIAIVMDQLTDVGATDILVLNIANTRTK